MKRTILTTLIGTGMFFQVSAAVAAVPAKPPVNTVPCSAVKGVTCVNKAATLSSGTMTPGKVAAGQAAVIPNQSVIAPKCYATNAVVKGVPQVQVVCSKVR